MDAEFIFQVTEEELAQFPEEGNQSQEEQRSTGIKTRIGDKGQNTPGIHRKTGKKG